MCEFDPMHCDCHEWARNAPRKSDLEKARRALEAARDARVSGSVTYTVTVAGESNDAESEQPTPLT